MDEPPASSNARAWAEEEVDAAPAITRAHVGEGNLTKVADVDDSPHHLADRELMTGAVEVTEHQQRSADRVLDHLARRVRDVAIPPPSLVPPPCREVAVGATEPW